MSKKKEKKISPKKTYPFKDSWVLIVLIGIILLPLLFFFFQRRNCLINYFELCIGSKEFASKNVPLSFRYPVDFPVDTPHLDWQIKQVHDEGEVESIDFSDSFSDQAGGDRMGFLYVKKTNYNSVYEYQKEVSKPVVYNGPQGKMIADPPKTTVVKIGNGLEALALDYSGIGSLFTAPNLEYVIIKNHLMYDIQFNYDSYYRHEPKEKYLEEFNFILSTIRL